LSAILRHRHPNRFTVLPNDAIRNPALSFRAVGVLAHLLSLPDGAKVDSATLAKVHKEGRDAVRAAYKELEAHGYYRREVLRLADGTLRTEVVVSSTPMKAEHAGRTGDGFSGVGPEPGNPAPVGPAPDTPASADPTPVDQAPKGEVPETHNLFSPPTPRTAGGHDGFVFTGQAGPAPGASPDGAGAPAGATRSRRQAGTNPRTMGTHPRAEAELAEAARLEAEAAARRAALEQKNGARRAADLAAQAETDRLEAEALAISAALDDHQLEAVVTLVTERMAGPLTRSPLAISRAVITWCRAAAAQRPGGLTDAISAGLAVALPAGERTAALDLPAAPPDTPTLRQRIGGLLNPTGTG
jgi:hypothetical protein